MLPGKWKSSETSVSELFDVPVWREERKERMVGVFAQKDAGKWRDGLCKVKVDFIG